MQNISSTLSLIFRRSGAFLYDCLLLIALFFFITATAIWFNDGEAIQNPLFKVLLFAVSFLFFDWFWRHGGQTLGMRAWRIKLEGIDSANVTLGQSGARFMTGALLFGLTFVYMLFNQDQLALHDKLSKTKIVKHNN